MGAALDGRPMLKNTIVTEDFYRCPGLKEQIGAPGEHEIGGSISGPDYISLKQGGIAAYYCAVDLSLTAGHDKAYA
jgi:hypothetical protein